MAAVNELLAPLGVVVQICDVSADHSLNSRRNRNLRKFQKMLPLLLIHLLRMGKEALLYNYAVLKKSIFFLAHIILSHSSYFVRSVNRLILTAKCKPI